MSLVEDPGTAARTALLPPDVSYRVHERATAASSPPLQRPLITPAARRVRRIGPLNVSLLTGDVVVVGGVAAPIVAGAGLSLWLVGAVCAPLVLCRAACRLHRGRLRLSWMDDLPRSVVALAVAFGLVAAGLLLAGSAAATTTAVGRAFLAAWVAAELVRAVLLRIARWKRTRFRGGERTLVVGAGHVGRDLVAKMRAHPEFGLHAIAVVDPMPLFSELQMGVPVVSDDIADAIRTLRAQTVVLAFSAQTESTTVDAAITAHRMGCRVLLVPRMFELYLDGVDVERLRNYPLVRLPEDPTQRPTWRIKRLLDVVLAAVALVVVAPVLAACAVAVLVESGRPIFFVQRRVGLDGRIFRLVKLRSLLPADEEESQTRWSIANDARIGRVGRVLRRTSLDELPQLWNILRGDMSLVGPRPERPGFVHHFTEQHERYWARHRVPAGLTGLAQVNGLRGDTSIADRARYDNYYIASWSLWLDVKVIMLTLRELWRRGEP